MALLGLTDVSVSFGEVPLLDRVSLQIEEGERISLVGRNGAGKTTLLRLMNGDLVPDTGVVSRRKGLRVARLEQDVPKDLSGKVYDIVSDGLGERGALIRHYHELSSQLASCEYDQALIDNLHDLEQRLHAGDGWQVGRLVDRILADMKLDPDGDCDKLSAGFKRRVLLAKALVGEPDLLLLDEPTNHMDIDSIQWMEETLLRFSGSILFVTHDRMFLRRMATRIVELDRGHISSSTCDYDTYLERREDILAAEEKGRAVFDKKLADEEAWLRKGVRARRTRNEGRVRALIELRNARSLRREQQGTVKLVCDEAQRTGKLVIDVKGLSFSYGDRPIVANFSTMIERGDKIGIIGPNGTGKTTLLKLLLGELKGGAGSVRHGENLEIAYFDQLKMHLDEDKTVQDNIAGGNEIFIFEGRPRHVIGYLKDFLFTEDRAKSPVWCLSGGERNRLLLAKLFTNPSNLLVFDEPTNDLDSETLDLLEELIISYSGTVLIVSHDRAFLNNIATSMLVIESDGNVGEYVGGYDDWLRQRVAPVEVAKRERVGRVREKLDSPRKMSYKEKRELQELPERIERLEREHKELYASMSEPAVYEKKGAVAEIETRLKELDDELAMAYERWQELEKF